MKSCRSLLLTTALAVVGLPAFADITYTTSGSNQGNGVSGSATFHLSGNTLQITLANTTSSVGTVAQVLDGFSFALSGTNIQLTASSLSVSAPNGFLDCTQNNTCATTSTFIDYTNQAQNDPGCGGNAAPATCTSPYTWALTAATTLKAGNGSLAPGGIVNTNTTAVSSIPNSQHNDYILGPATFSLTYTGTITDVDSATFLWGTNAGSTTGSPSGPITFSTGGGQVPEPGSIVLFGSICVGLTTVLRKKVQQKS